MCYSYSKCNVTVEVSYILTHVIRNTNNFLNKIDILAPKKGKCICKRKKKQKKEMGEGKEESTQVLMMT